MSLTKWKCENCGFIYVGNDTLVTCVKCGMEGTYRQYSTEMEGIFINWKCKKCGYQYVSDVQMEMCPFCKTECPFVDNSNYLPKDAEPQKPKIDEKT